MSRFSRSRVDPYPPTDAQVCIEAVCCVFDIDESAFRERNRRGCLRRHPDVVRARAVASALMRKHTRLSTPEISDAVGFGSHSSVIAASRKGVEDPFYAVTDAVASLGIGGRARMLRRLSMGAVA